MNSLQDVIDEGFTVEDGIVQDFGKFENEPWQTVVLWGVYLDGFGEMGEAETCVSFELEDVADLGFTSAPTIHVCDFGFVSLIEGEIG